MAAEAVATTLWEEYRRTRRPEVRDRLVLHYSGLAKYVAGRIAATLPAHVPRDDITSQAILGLIDAVDRFDPEQGVRFEHYAPLRIRGAVLDALRQQDWVPRAVRETARRVEHAVAALEARLHRAPTEAELAEALGMSEAALQRTLEDASLRAVVSLDDLSRQRPDTRRPADTLADLAAGPSEIQEHAEEHRLVAAELARMPERERTVLVLYYYEGLTLAQIGEVLGVTESRVSQIHTKAVVQLRARLEADHRRSA